MVSIARLPARVFPLRASDTNPETADLYDSRAMPSVLRKAHHALDKAVERAYRKSPFRGDRERVEYLFGLYQKRTAPLTAMRKRRSNP